MYVNIGSREYQEGNSGQLSYCEQDRTAFLGLPIHSKISL